MIEEITKIKSMIEELQKKVNALENKDPRNHSRYPFTYACDYIRSHFGVKSRSEASRKIADISDILNEPNHEKVAILFAEAFIAKDA